MRTVILAAAALAVGVALAGSAKADGYGYGYGYGAGYGPSGISAGFGGPNRGFYIRSYYGSRPYYKTYGQSYHGGHFYPGRDHGHWSHRVWSETYHRYHYYDPYLRCNYYYCPTRQGFYPVP